ncbi:MULTISPECIES: succinylglutamate desuccinylase/aspartoacylase family protein [Pseudomonas]|uniref:Succinylglutamate desuccinylase/aspartoacylase family protein n=1 Tax=Pseudomonas donghuensis TaxID=1163398 RepID=A0AAP0SI69_9PSED|nr:MULTISPECIES: succinylglutamate desuccinylase/aspartoacylase family protein [Pseudomonas]MDF9892960.1 putative deacylase [Pseudomonas vranovensis]KDO00959.1 succinylglutamate desuccinylase/aspartoacylase family protein [Pseudomonas donghuensis]MBF4207054.1 succinylglutamate desuccinylase/aspartoacylase family protein [Pseudomonas donghuensis]MBS7600613.1 succinylglutamate desuccinylase/aspartoacylase family protein [Pseudomonas sp. RC2C2]MCP6694225.1 M14 family metallopeptidase [Pseudomonas
MQQIDHVLPWSACGTQRTLRLFRFGSGPRKAYIQASLHADELPGMRVAVELKRRLGELEAQGRLSGVIELVPLANPIGIGQMFQATHQGRFEFNSGKNFNRDFPPLTEALVARLEGQLGSDGAANVATIRRAMAAALAELPAARSELDGLRRVLLQSACDADLVLDLHCDFESVMLLYALPQNWPSLRSLAARLGAEAVLLAEDAGGDAFDEACAVPWLRLREYFPEAEIPLACVATTVELRGMADTGREQCQASAEQILGYLADQGLISGDWPEAPSQCCVATPFAGAQYAYAEHPGVVSYLQPLGAWVSAGDPLFEVIDPLSDRHSVVRASIDGILYARERLRFAQPGLWLAKVAGTTPIRHGRLLTD